MSKSIALLIAFVIWYNVIAFIALDINFINWSWLERAAFIILCVASLNLYTKDNHE